MLSTRQIAILGIGLLGCHSAPPTPPSDGGLGWRTVEVTLHDTNIVVERVSYGGTGAQPRVFGRVCRPAGSSGRHPVIVLSRGGFSGLKGDANGGLCVTFARKGYIAIEPSYRGEDGSQGHVEVCLGEVDDVLAMLQMSLDYAYWQGELASGAGASSSVLHGLMAQLDESVGGPPNEKAASYQARSPIAFVSSVPSTPLILAHGACGRFGFGRAVVRVRREARECAGVSSRRSTEGHRERAGGLRRGHSPLPPGPTTDTFSSTTAWVTSLRAQAGKRWR